MLLHDMFFLFQGKATHPKKHTHTQIERVCTNSLRKLFLSACFLRILKGKGGGDNLHKLSRNRLRKLCFYLGGWLFGGGSPLHDYLPPFGDGKKSYHDSNRRNRILLHPGIGEFSPDLRGDFLTFVKKQNKYIKNSCIKNLRDPEIPPLEILYVWDFSYILRGKEAPYIKNWGGDQGLPGGGSAWEVSVEILYVYAFFGGLIGGHFDPEIKYLAPPPPPRIPEAWGEFLLKPFISQRAQWSKKINPARNVQSRSKF